MDVITYTGANSDWELFENYLNAGGSLFLQGEHHDYYIRNTNLLMFVNHVASAPITSKYPGCIFNNYTINDYQSAPENFSTDFNDLASIGSITGNFTGYIPLNQRGSGQPLVNVQDGGVTGAMALAYLPGNLVTSMGRMVVSFETNGFTESGLQNAASEAFIQNVYDLLSGCYRYEITKEFSPNQLCIGETGSFDLCYQNNGTRDLENIYIWDTIPTCFQFLNSTPGPTGNNGNLYWWYIGTVPAGSGKICITVNYRAVSLPPCP